MKKQDRQAKIKQEDPKLIVAISDAPKSPANDSDVRKEIQSRLRSTKFKNGFRILSKAKLNDNEIAAAELDFRILTGAEEIIQALRYEYLRELEGAYRFKSGALNAKPKTGTDQTSRRSSVLPRFPWIDERLDEYFPLPYSSVPEPVRAQLRIKKKRDCVLELNETEFADWQSLYPTMGPRTAVILSLHRIAIYWKERTIKQVKRVVSEWIAKQAPAEAKLQHKNELIKRPEDALSQLCAWRARRAGISHSQYKGILRNIGNNSESRVLAYKDNRAYDTAAKGAEQRALKLREPAVG